MSKWQQSAQTDAYKEALQATESISNPALGFANSELPGPNKILIKQLNTCLQLLITSHNKVDQLQERVQKLEKLERQQATTTPLSTSSLVDELSAKLKDLKLGAEAGSASTIRAPRKTYFFVDPQEIFRKERAKKQKQ